MFQTVAIPHAVAAALLVQLALYGIDIREAQAGFQGQLLTLHVVLASRQPLAYWYHGASASSKDSDGAIGVVPNR